MKSVIDLSSWFSISAKSNLRARLNKVLGLDVNVNRDIVDTICSCEQMGMWANYNYNAIRKDNNLVLPADAIELINLIIQVDDTTIIAPEFMMSDKSVMDIRAQLVEGYSWVKCVTLSQYMEVCGNHQRDAYTTLHAMASNGFVDSTDYSCAADVAMAATQLRKVLDERIKADNQKDDALREVLNKRYNNDTDMVEHIMGLISLAELIK